MKSARGTIHRLVERPDGQTRFYLFHGPDEGQSRTLADRLLASLKASKQILAGSSLRGDPAALLGAAGAMSLFGEAQAVWIEPAGDDTAEAVRGLLEAAAVESPVIAIAGRLAKSSALLKLAEAHPLALTHVSYEPDARELERLIGELARAEGLRPEPGVTGRIADYCGGDQRVAGQELAKLALYVGASPQAPRDLRHQHLDDVGAAMRGDFLKIADLALAGEIRELADELSRLPAGGNEAIPILRSLQRRLLMLAPIRARVDAGDRPEDAMTSAGKALFWKDKPLVGRLLSLWDSHRLERLAYRAGTLERLLMRGDSPPAAEALGEELLAIARAARRR